jgi:hypothetical protein
METIMRGGALLEISVGGRRLSLGFEEAASRLTVPDPKAQGTPLSRMMAPLRSLEAGSRFIHRRVLGGPTSEGLNDGPPGCKNFHRDDQVGFMTTNRAFDSARILRSSAFT